MKIQPILSEIIANVSLTDTNATFRQLTATVFIITKNILTQVTVVLV